MPDNKSAKITLNDATALPVVSPSGASNRISRSRNNSRSRSPNNSRSTSRNRTRRDTESAFHDAIPLIPERNLPRPRPPIAGPEIDDENEGENYGPTHGIDDGFFDVNTRNDDYPGADYPDAEKGEKIPLPERPHNGNGNGNGKIPRPRAAEFPYAQDFPAVIPRTIPDVNVYQQKKTLAQGMMDLALLSANANQLRYVLESRERHPYFHFSLVFISLSIVIQVLVGLGLVLNSRYNVKKEDDICKANRINDMITVGILLITIVNVFVSAFGVAEKTT